jgi:glycosyltransferase involved in cell wall biosynthesis
MSACELFVLSSAWEGFGLVVAEAMAYERPVVATDCGGVREVVGDCGTLVSPRDPEAFAIAIEKTLSMTQPQKKAVGYSARQRVVARYSIDAMAERYLAVYRGKS